MSKTRKNRNKYNKTKKKTFKKKDFGSGDGFLTTVWGPEFWFGIHTMSFNYPVNPSEEDKKHYLIDINLTKLLEKRIDLKKYFESSLVFHKI